MLENLSLSEDTPMVITSIEDLCAFIDNDDYFPFVVDSTKAPTTENLIQNKNFFFGEDKFDHLLNSVGGSDESMSSSFSNYSKSSSNGDNEEEMFNLSEWLIKDKVSLKNRPPKLYEFLRLLLNNSRYQSYATWINESQGLFKIHRPMQVAYLWKRIKGRRTSSTMDYDTFARGIRYYYKSGTMKKTYTKHTYCFTNI